MRERRGEGGRDWRKRKGDEEFTLARERASERQRGKERQGGGGEASEFCFFLLFVPW